MTTAPTPSELLALRAGATQQIRLREKFGPEGLDLTLDPQIVIRLLDRIHDLERKVGRIQGVPMALIEAINKAAGSNEWQGDHSPAELLEPACRAIEALRAEKPMPTIEDASQEWGKVDPITAWHLIERHADSWADIGKMMTEYVQAQIARAELEARKPLPLSDEQIDAIADGMPGGLGGFMKTWGWRQFARKILDLRAPPTWEPQFDCMAPGQEELAIQFCAEIAGPRGQPGRNPDPVRLLEMAEALYKAEADSRGITGGSSLTEQEKVEWARRCALEEAAKICDDQDVPREFFRDQSWPYEKACNDLADAIRAMKDKP